MKRAITKLFHRVIAYSAVTITTLFIVIFLCRNSYFILPNGNKLHGFFVANFSNKNNLYYYQYMGFYYKFKYNCFDDIQLVTPLNFYLFRSDVLDVNHIRLYEWMYVKRLEFFISSKECDFDNLIALIRNGNGSMTVIKRDAKNYTMIMDNKVVGNIFIDDHISTFYVVSFYRLWI